MAKQQTVAELKAELAQVTAERDAANKKAEALARKRAYGSLFENEKATDDNNHPQWKGSIRVYTDSKQGFEWNDMSMWETDPSKFDPESDTIPVFNLSLSVTSEEYAEVLEERYQEWLAKKAAGK